MLVIVFNSISPYHLSVKYVPFENTEPVLGIYGIQGQRFVPCGVRVPGTFLEATIFFSMSASHFSLQRVPVTPSVQSLSLQNCSIFLS